MANKFTKLFNTEKSKYFWAYIVIGALLMIVSIILMPFWADIAPDLFFSSWGADFVKIVIAGVLALYLIEYLYKKMSAVKIKVVKVLAVIEFVILSLVAVGCIISQFSAFALDVSVIFAIALLMRGTVEIFRAYYYNNASDKYPVIELIVAILLVALGGYAISSTIITNEIILWVATLIAFLFSLVIFVIGFYKKPKTEKKPKKVKEKKS